jgi:hypothetical protein
MRKLVQGGAVACALVAVTAWGQEKKAAPATGGAAAKPAAAAPSGAAAKPAAGGAATGAPAAAPPEMKPPTPGPETMLLKPLAASLTTTGQVPANAMGPGSPATASKGTHVCKWTPDKLWLSCEISDTMGSGKMAMTWKGHMFNGYDYTAKAYRAFVTDNWGMGMMLQGKAEGSKIVLESVGEYEMMGHPMRMRATLDLTDPKAIKFTDERQMGKGGPWTVFEEVTMKPGK